MQMGVLSSIYNLLDCFLESKRRYLLIVSSHSVRAENWICSINCGRVSLISPNTGSVTCTTLLMFRGRMSVVIQNIRETHMREQVMHTKVNNASSAFFCC
jgi:hypothetical protein